MSMEDIEQLNQSLEEISENIRKTSEDIERINREIAKLSLTPSYSVSVIPRPCRSCLNHPSNGGSGICNCTLGGTTIF